MKKNHKKQLNLLLLYPSSIIYSKKFLSTKTQPLREEFKVTENFLSKGGFSNERPTLPHFA